MIDEIKRICATESSPSYSESEYTIQKDLKNPLDFREYISNAEFIDKLKTIIYIIDKVIPNITVRSEFLKNHTSKVEDDNLYLQYKNICLDNREIVELFQSAINGKPNLEELYNNIING